ncbi:unnamed protein product [Ceratitis capitata]|uniref:(Mediterranean fruit fly) hypothetical protein n=2 Tax=Ceratitis capitata TaxID=7213 RepID=A0A811V2J4_CERCA|nr:unnamed protein product [Ceratitis capitata]
MRSLRLSTFLLLAVAIAFVAATPLKRQSSRLHQQQRSARQLAATTVQPVLARTGYPLAGFRPHIPFELPSERKPKELPNVSSTTVASAAEATTLPPEDRVGSNDVNIDVEVIIEGAGQEENDERVATTTTESAEVMHEVTEAEIETHTPAIEYGPPTVEAAGETVEEPAEHFQPPNRDAEDFAAPAPSADAHIDADAGSAANSADSDAPVHPIADFPSVAEEIFPPLVASSDAGPAPIDVSHELDAEAAEQPIPAATYGPPTGSDEAESRLPADTYGAPGGVASDVVPPQAVEEDFGVELNELEPVADAEDADLAAEQIELLSGLSDLQSGRLIFVPSDGSNLRQIFFAAPPQQRRAERNGRLVRV